MTPKSNKEEEAKPTFPILESVQDTLITDLLTESSRTCRKTLFIFCLICLAVTWGGLFPSEINVFGFKVSKIERANLLYLLALATAYYTVSFASYSYSDSKLRKLKITLGRLKARQEVVRVSGVLKEWPKGADLSFFDSEEFRQAAVVSDQAKLVNEVLKAGRYKQLVDVYLPVIVGITSVLLVLREAGSLPSIEVLIALAVFVSLVTGGILVQSRWFKSKWPLWKIKLAVGIMKPLVARLERAGPTSWKRKVLEPLLNGARRIALGKAKAPEQESGKPSDDDA